MLRVRPDPVPHSQEGGHRVLPDDFSSLLFSLSSYKVVMSYSPGLRGSFVSNSPSLFTHGRSLSYQLFSSPSNSDIQAVMSSPWVWFRYWVPDPLVRLGMQRRPSLPWACTRIREVGPAHQRDPISSVLVATGRTSGGLCQGDGGGKTSQRLFRTLSRVLRG